MNDLINRQEAIDAIVNTPSEVQNKNIPLVNQYDGATFRQIEILGILEALPSAQPEQRWIPCSEGLPKAGEYVGDVAKYYLVQNEFGDMMVARHTHSEYWEQMYQLQPIKDKIVAWMPLPEPYKEEKDES